MAPSGSLEGEKLGPGTIVCGGVLDEEGCFAPDGEAGGWSAYKPKLLWWCKSEMEEDREVNFLVNSGFLIAVIVTVAVRLASSTLDASRGWTAEEVLLRLPQDNWQGYMDMLRSHPVLVKAVTSGTVYALGDWTAQTTNGTPLAELDRWRVARSAAAGFVGHGPLSHCWYEVCEALFSAIGWNGAWWVTLPKIMTDQLVWGPIWNATYVVLVGLMKRDAPARVWEAVTSTMVPLVVSGLKLWPAVHLVTYGLIPPENRLLWVDTVEILWVTILSKQAADEAKRDQPLSTDTAADEDGELTPVAVLSTAAAAEEPALAELVK
ncbi:hypothetical protein JKP88DRAFT_196506 [Tribonema minus]|uniref:Uncharacterized protein n=1 Tax=Tribonema minus TaxID=303371 RepID=A0A836C8Z2_9STRA|nr:hypothetical protein JKP88DRAFT_196506 [Tribonema minus]